MMYALAAVLGIVIVFFGSVYFYGFLLAIYDGIRSLLGMPPRSIHSLKAAGWIWINNKAVRKATMEEIRLQGLHGAYTHAKEPSLDKL